VKRTPRAARSNAPAPTGAFVFLAGCGLAAPVTPTPPPASPVRLLVEPDAGKAAVLDLMASARRAIWAELYLLTDGDAIAALAGRAAAGCDVRVLLEPAPYQAETANQPAFAQLAAAGADVRWATARFTYTHAKTFTVDHATLAVLTLNLTASGLAGNREYAAVDSDPADVAAMEALFAADQVGQPTSAPGGRLVTSPESSRGALLALFAGARSTLALETEELSDGEALGALLAARARGVAVTLAWPGPTAGAPAAFQTLAAAGATVRAVSAPSIHGKVVVADGRGVYLGSANLSTTSLDADREVGLRLDDPALARAIAATVAADAASGAPP
jgi:phosphatidylserine/phosphatidylglycerophosphate/cardiolipin synthase-like enzyme